MKRNKLILGTLSIAAVAAAVLVWNPINSSIAIKYNQKDLSALKTETGGNEAAKFFATKMIDAQTGEYITNDRYKEVANYYKFASKSNVIEWIEQGPANVGGRTRAIAIDHENINNIWAGSVSGGLFYSPSRGNFWQRVASYPGTQMISSMTMDASGNLYVATGHTGTAEASFPLNAIGDGVYVSTDKGATWEQVPGTDSFSAIRDIVSSPNINKVYFSTNSDLRSWTYGDAVTEQIDIGVSGISVGGDLAISDDGQVIVYEGPTQRTLVSTDAGLTWTDNSSQMGGNGSIARTGWSRIEYAISKKKSDGQHSIYASTTTASNAGQWISNDNGATWFKHTGASGQGSALDIFRNQGAYNNISTFDPTDTERVLIGGIDVWSWKQIASSPSPTGSWDQKSQWFLPEQSPLYVHADVHEFKWNSANELFIGSDGGVGVSLDQANTFYPANRGYNVTQFYDVAYDKNGSVLGGAQDNGTQYNDHTNATYQDFVRVTGGDGFDCAISFFNPNVMFSTIQFGDLRRSGDAGKSFGSFLPDVPFGYSPVGQVGNSRPFHTSIKLGEYYDTNSEDSILFIPRESYDAGDLVKVPSFSTGDTIEYITPRALYFDDTLNFDPALTTVDYIITDVISGFKYDLGELSFTPFATASGNYPPEIGDSLLVSTPFGDDTVVVEATEAYDHFFGSNTATGQIFDLRKDTLTTNVAWDTIVVQDPFQSWLVIFISENGGEVWGTRDALRLSDLSPQWVKLVDNVGSGGECEFEFSEDLNHLFVASNGPVKRVSGLGQVYTSDTLFKDKVDIDESPITTITNITGVSRVNGIGMTPNNPDVLFASVGEFGGAIYRCDNATQSSPAFTNLGTEPAAFFDFVIDRQDGDLIVAATSNGAMVSENGGTSWLKCTGGSEGFDGVPSYSITQNWRPNGPGIRGNNREGEIYLATYGRGIFSSESVLGLPDDNSSATIEDKEESSISIYPNPFKYNTTLAYELVEPSKVEIMIFNLSGRMVKQLNTTAANAGKNTIEFNASSLPSGTYIVKFKAGNTSHTTKFIKM